MKKYWLGWLFVVVSGLCLSGYAIVGSQVDEKGFLRESFGLIPLAWLSLLLACGLFLYVFFRK